MPRAAGDRPPMRFVQPDCASRTACDCGICGFDYGGDVGLVAWDFLARAEVQDDAVMYEGVHLGPVVAQLEIDLLQEDEAVLRIIAFPTVFGVREEDVSTFIDVILSCSRDGGL